MTSNTVDLILTTINEPCSATCRIIRTERKPEETRRRETEEENKFNIRRRTRTLRGEPMINWRVCVHSSSAGRRGQAAR